MLVKLYNSSRHEFDSFLTIDNNNGFMLAGYVVVECLPECLYVCSPNDFVMANAMMSSFRNLLED